MKGERRMQGVGDVGLLAYEVINKDDLQMRNV